MEFEYLEETQLWLLDVLTNHLEEARSRAFSTIGAALPAETGCLVTTDKTIKKVRFRGRQMVAYRFIYCVLNGVVAGYDDVVRHRCNNRRCINPDHLEIGSRGENLQDEREFAANGVDYDPL